MLDLHPFRTLNDSDGTIINTSEAYESVFIETLRSWLSGMSKSFYSVGPTIPVDFMESKNFDKTDDQNEIETFLNSALEKYGRESVIYVRIGLHVEFVLPILISALVRYLLDRRSGLKTKPLLKRSSM